jgi:hypothetical protein
MSRHIEFTVERLTTEDGRVLIDGRVCESPIRVGDVFTKIYGHRQRWDGKQWVTTDPGPTDAIRLVIRSIESYRRSWNELSSGMTARLEVVGDGLDRVAEGRILGDDWGAQQTRCSEPGDEVSAANPEPVAPGR